MPQLTIDEIIDRYEDPKTDPKVQLGLEKQRRQIRKEAEASLWYFTKYVLRYPDLYEPLHKPFCDWVQEPDTQLILMPRGHFKSTVVSVAYPIWILVKYPDTAILLANNTLENTIKWLAEQVQHIRTNRVLHWLFPEIVPQDPTTFGFQEKYTIPSKKAPWKEGSVEVTSVERNVVGRHYHVIICDDLVSEKNSRTKEGMERTEAWYQHANALLTPTSQEKSYRLPKDHVKLVGTRYSFDDLYGTLLKDGRLPVYLKRAIEDGKPIFGSRFTLEMLEELKHPSKLGISTFWSQYMNEPISPGDAVFKQPDIQRCIDNYPTTITDQLAVVLTVDLAASLSKTADSSSIAVTGVDSKGNLYDLDLVTGHLQPSEIIDSIYYLYAKWRAWAVYIEANGFQTLYQYLLTDEARRRGKWLNVKPTTFPSTSSKKLRIMGLQPLVAVGAFYIRKENTKLIEQMQRYPKVKHDDTLDAYAMRVQDNVWGTSISVLPTVSSLTDEWYTIQDKVRKQAERKANSTRRMDERRFVRWVIAEGRRRK